MEKERFINENNEINFNAHDFMCSLCLDIPKDIVFSIPCGHTFCEKIKHPSVNRCPECKCYFSERTFFWSALV